MRMTDENFLKMWEAARQRGFWGFVLVEGAMWGACVATIYLMWTWPDDHALDPRHAAAAFLVFIMFGWVFSPIMWWKREDRYKRALEQGTAEPPR
jgi:hypothetical protein